MTALIYNPKGTDITPSVHICTCFTSTYSSLSISSLSMRLLLCTFNIFR
jgi:hypothetical protein